VVIERVHDPAGAWDEAIGPETGCPYDVRMKSGGETMRTKVCSILIAVLVCSLMVAAQEGSTGAGVENLSADRTLGVGIQVDYPFGGLLSGRYWFSSDLAGEAILFLWSDGGDVEGTVTARALYRIADRPVADFYGAVGASIPVSSYGGETVYLSAAGGIEFGFRSAPSLAWNIEFGVAYSTDGELSMAFGTGVHFYF